MHPGPWHSLLCVSLLLLSTHGDSDVTPRFLSEPLSTVQKPGAPVTLLCATEPPWFQISWLFNGEILNSTQDLDIQPDHLTILSLGLHHAGRYQCMLNTSRGSLISTSANVSVAYLGDFKSSSRLTVVAEVGSNAIISCGFAPSVPDAQIQYRVKGKWLNKSTDKYLLLPSGNLQILNVTLEDQGPYRCAARNPVTHERRTSPSIYKLSVTTPSDKYPFPVHPVITRHTSVHLHDSLTLECEDVKVAALRVRWDKDGHDATEDSRRTLWYNHLVIRTVERLDAGNYTCLLANETKEYSIVTYTVTVLEAPLISRALEDQTALVGSDITFTCETQGNPHPNITWLHNALRISPSSRFHPHDNKLHVGSVAAEDAGMYQCMADNGVGVVQSAARLNIQSDSGSRPTIVSPPTSVSAVIGDRVKMTCNATGNPTPTIRWYNTHGVVSSHPSQILRTKSRKGLQSRIADSASQDPVHIIMSQAGSSSLYIPSVTVKHAGIYTCEAVNDFGSIREEATLRVVLYEMSTARTSSGHTPTTKHPFQPSTLPTDKPIHVAMLPEAPIILSPPQTTKPDVYYLVWRSGQDGGLPINAYFVRYRKLDDDGNEDGTLNSIRVPASENEFLLTELEPSSLYEVIMVARNAAGEGQPAMLTFRTSKERSSSSKNTQAPSPPAGPPKQTHFLDYNRNSGLNQDSFRYSGVPEAPDRPTISTASETSVYVTWIPRANGGSPITSFKVEYKKAGKQWMVAAENIPPSKLSVEVSNLESGAMYKFRVIAINNYGESLWSTASRPYQVAVHGGRQPNPLIVGPRIDYTEAATDSQILLKWTYIPSNNNNTPIQGFYIYYRPTDSDNDSDYRRDEVKGSEHQHYIRNLQPETSYDIKMQCFNDHGTSEYSNVMMCETKARRNPGASEFPPLELSTTSASERSSGGSSGSSSALARSGDMLYVIVGCVLGGMVLILMTFIAICLLKHRQQRLLHKFEPPGYLYQGSDLSSQMIEYTTLPGTNRINGNVHGGYIGNGNIPNGCPHMHHSIHNGMNGVLNGELYPTCANSHKGTCPDYKHLQHNISNGGLLYSAVPQADPAECVSCRNCCNNNNRCFNKANGSYNSNGMARMPLHQGNQEGKPLTPEAVPMILSSLESECETQPEEEVAEQELSPCTSCLDGIEDIEGDVIVKEDSTILSSSPDTSPRYSQNCDESKSWTLDTPTNDLPHQLPTQEA